MKRKLLFILIAVIVVSSFVGILSACNPDEDSTPVNGKANFTITGNGAHIQWDAVEGSALYLVSKSATRLGEYTLAGTTETNEIDVDDANAYYQVTAVVNGNNVDVGKFSYELELFGYNTYVYTSADNKAQIQAELDAFYNKVDGTVETVGTQGRARGEFTDDRLSVLFKDGEYNLNVNVGYYTTVSGLGASPSDVTVSQLNSDAHISLCNFWRGVENLTVNGNMQWAVSQATSLRRVHVKGNLNLFSQVGDKTTSGGFLADTLVDGTVASGNQQQWFSRNSAFGKWNGGVWNMAFVGVEGSNIPTDSWNAGGYTNIPTSANLREKPFLTYDETAGYRVFVPSLTTNAKGYSWQNTNGGAYIPLSDFYVARGDRDNATTINAALAAGKNIIFTAGIYQLDKPIVVNHANTVILGLGMATLRPTSGNNDTLLRISDVDGVSVSGLLFDAGSYTKSLLEVGEASANANHSANPSVFSDLYFRVGGRVEANTSVDACVVINSNNVIGDNFWVWRADHWDGVGWTSNVAKNGVIINGDNVTFYGLFVEHFLEYQTLWNGNGGTTYFYQSELPYDVPNQAAWMSHDGTVNGYASYKVADGVTSHKAYALGVYSYLRDAAVRLYNAVECPTVGNITFYHVMTVYLNGMNGSGIDHVINGLGDAVLGSGQKSGINEYSATNS